MNRNLIICLLSITLIISLLPMHQSKAAEDSLTFEHPEYFNLIDWNANGDTIYAFGYHRVNKTDSRKNLLLIDKNTLEVKDTVQILEEPTNQVLGTDFYNHSFYISTDNKIYKYDMKQNETSLLLEIKSEYIDQLEVKDHMIYFTTSSMGSEKLDNRLSQYNMNTNEVSKIAEASDSFIDQPTIKVHPTKDIIYFAQSYVKSYSAMDTYYLEAYNTNNGSLIEKTSFEKDEQISGSLLFNDGKVYYGKYVFNEDNLSEPIGEFNFRKETFPKGIQYIKNNKAFTQGHVYDLNTLKHITEVPFNTRLTRFIIDNENMVYQFDHYSEPDRQVITKTPLVSMLKPEFKDLDRFEDEINYLRNLGIINGISDTKFGPKQSIKRVDTMRMIIRELDVELTDVVDPGFTDIRPGEPGYKEVAKAYELGIVEGKSESIFDPNGNLTRAEMAKIISIVYNLEGTYEKEFTDVEEGFWGAPFIHTLAANKITVGYPDGSFKPNNEISRQDFAGILARQINDEFKPE